MTSLIFGAAGQDGFYLAELLRKKGHELITVSRSGDHIHADVSEFSTVKDLVTNHQPDFIFHLAAKSTTDHSALFENHATIATGSLSILEAVKKFSPHSKIFISGSGLQFKNDGKPIKETDEFEARDAYSVSRIQSVFASRYFRSLGIKTYVGYFFNHDSPRRSENHMTKKIAETAKRIGKGSKEQIEIGDIEVIKEYTFAGDVVKGIWTLVSQDKIVEANIASGKGHSIKEWLDQCFSLVGKNWKDHVVIKKDFTPEYQQLVADPALIFSLGWKPEVSFEELASMMMNA